MQLFAKWFYGFTPERMPFITFSQASSRDALLRKAKPGDRIVYVVADKDVAPAEYRGRVVGMAEIGRQSLSTDDLALEWGKFPAHSLDEKGRFLWPEAIPMLRAWRFNELESWKEVLGENWRRMSAAAQAHAILLDESEQISVLSRACAEIQLPDIEFIKKQRELNDALTSVPKEWGFEAARMARDIIKTVANSNGQIVERTVKIKNTNLDETNLQLLIRKLLEEQKYRCKITGHQLELKGAGNSWLMASPDRIDSNGDYIRENMQILCWAANKAKSDIAPEQIKAYFDVLQYVEHVKSN